MRDALFTSPKLADAMSRNTFEMPPGVVGTGDLLDVLQGFVHELRAAGLPVSMTENLDAMQAVKHIPLEDREVSTVLERSFTKRGIRVMTTARFDVASVVAGKDGVRLTVGPEGGAT